MVCKVKCQIPDAVTSNSFKNNTITALKGAQNSLVQDHGDVDLFYGTIGTFSTVESIDSIPNGTVFPYACFDQVIFMANKVWYRTVRYGGSYFMRN